MILCAGLTPAWQQIMVFDDLEFGQVARAREVIWCASGKVFNAGMAVHSLGAPSRTLSPVGGLPAAAIEAETSAIGLPCRLLKTEAPTRVCTTLINARTGLETELVENAHPLRESELAAFAKAFHEEAADAEAVILIGSLPRGTPDAYYRELLAPVRCPVICDYRGPGLQQSLDLLPLVVKPNREELARTVNRSLSTSRDVMDAARELAMAGARWVVVTDRAEATWIVSKSEVHRITPPKLTADEVVNPIGCGDAMAGALAVAAIERRPMPEAMRFATAASIDNLRSLLPCRLDRARIERLASELEVEEIVA